MKQIVIIGAGGFGREAFAMAGESAGYGTEFDVKGFLDARADALDGFAGYPPVVGDPATYVPEADDVFITALGSVRARKRCAEAVEAKGGRFVSLVHKSVFMGPNVTIGDGCYIAPGVSLTADVAVGRHADVFHLKASRLFAGGCPEVDCNVARFHGIADDGVLAEEVLVAGDKRKVLHGRN